MKILSKIFSITTFGLLFMNTALGNSAFEINPKFHPDTPFRGLQFNYTREVLKNNESSFGVKLQFKNLFALQEQVNFRKALITTGNFIENEELLRSLKDQAKNKANNLRLNALKSLLKEWDAFSDRLKTTASLESKKSDSNLRSIVKLKIQLDKTKADIVEQKQKIITEQLAIGSTSNKSHPIIENWSIKKAREIIQNLKNNINERSNSETFYLNQINLQQAKTNYDTEKNSIWLDSINIDSKKEKGKSRELSLGISINIPIFSQSFDPYYDSQKNYYDQMNLIEKQNFASNSKTGNIYLVEEKVALLEDISSETSISERSLKLLATQDPILSLELQSSIIAHKIKIIELVSEIQCLLLDLSWEFNQLSEKDFS